MASQQGMSDSDTGVSDVTFDVMTLLSNKLEALAAMDVYMQDAEDAGDNEFQQYLQKLMQQDHQDVQKLKGMLAKRLS